MTDVYVVTGGASGIGFATACRLTTKGSVVAVVRSPDQADAIAEELGAVPSVGDVTDSETARAAAETAESLGAVKGLVCAAGVFIGGSAEEVSLSDWQQTLNVNLTGSFLFARALLPALRANRGAIVFIASDFGIVAGRDAAAYIASKWGVVGLAKSIALDNAAEGVRANAICPGNVDTPMLAAQGEQMGIGREGILADTAAHYPIGRAANSEEIAAAIEFLLIGEGASYLTGAAVPVDGGFTAA